LQLDALERAGCERVYEDVGSGTIRRRPQLDACLDYLRAGDTLVVWRLDRLGRSLRHLVELVGVLHEREIAFRSLTEAIDTNTPAGRLQLHLFAALAELERNAEFGTNLVKFTPGLGVRDVSDGRRIEAVVPRSVETRLVCTARFSEKDSPPRPLPDRSGIKSTSRIHCRGDQPIDVSVFHVPLPLAKPLPGI
jgi:hypothetical protein